MKTHQKWAVAIAAGLALAFSFGSLALYLTSAAMDEGRDIRAERGERLACIERALGADGVQRAGDISESALMRRVIYLEGLLDIKTSRWERWDYRIARVQGAAERLGRDIRPCLRGEAAAAASLARAAAIVEGVVAARERLLHHGMNAEPLTMRRLAESLEAAAVNDSSLALLFAAVPEAYESASAGVCAGAPGRGIRFTLASSVSNAEAAALQDRLRDAVTQGAGEYYRRLFALDEDGQAREGAAPADGRAHLCVGA